jgi:hypothetical protein
VPTCVSHLVLFLFPCVVAMAIFVVQSVNERPPIYFTGFMSGARVAGSPAGACVQCAGHRSTDSDRTSNSVNTRFSSFFLFLFCYKWRRVGVKRQPLDGSIVSHALPYPLPHDKQVCQIRHFPFCFIFFPFTVDTYIRRSWCFSFIRASSCDT